MAVEKKVVVNAADFSKAIQDAIFKSYEKGGNTYVEYSVSKKILEDDVVKEDLVEFFEDLNEILDGLGITDDEILIRWVSESKDDGLPP